MGYNTTLVVFNDALTDIEKDKDFGRKVSEAVQRVGKKQVEISCGCHITAAIVVESHTSEIFLPILVGGNSAQVVGTYGVSCSAEDPELDLLKQLAEKYGFCLRRNPNHKIRNLRKIPNG